MIPAPVYSDAARRCSDIVNNAVGEGHRGWWVAVRLSDGGSDGVLYASREAAIKHQIHESQCAYVQVPWDQMTPREAEAFLGFHRKCYDAGFRLTDPDAPEPVMPTRLEDLP